MCCQIVCECSLKRTFKITLDASFAMHVPKRCRLLCAFCAREGVFLIEKERTLTVTAGLNNVSECCVTERTYRARRAGSAGLTALVGYVTGVRKGPSFH